MLREERGRLSPCVCNALRMVSRVVTQLYDDILRPSGLRVTRNLALVRRHLSVEGQVGVLPSGREGHRRVEAVAVDRLSSKVSLPHGVSDREATFLLDILVRLKERRFGRLTLTVSDGRVVDVEVIEKIDHDLLRRLSV